MYDGMSTSKNLFWKVHDSVVEFMVFITSGVSFWDYCRKTVKYVDPIQDSLFIGCSQTGGGQTCYLPKICHTYST